MKRIRNILLFLAATTLVGWWASGGDDIFQDPYSTVLEATDGSLLGAHIAADGQWRFPIIDSVPALYVKAVTTYEDKRYYSHLGVDPMAIGRAALGNLKAGKVTSGASTITMQTIRLSRKGKARSLWQKIVEAALALRLETHSSKEDILRLYASHAPFGGNVVGLETASWRYFHKKPTSLSVAECAMLAVLPNAPSLIHVGKNRARLKAKRDDLLADMLTEKQIDSLTYTLALLEDIPPAPYPLPQLAPHLLTHLRKTIPDKYRHKTTVDLQLQKRAADVVNYHHALYQQTGIENMGVVLLDTKSGAVLSYVGNAPAARREHAVDMVQARRSSGSVLKPLLYAHMLDDGLLTPDMLLTDIPTEIAGYRPRNYNRSYTGVVPASEALARSLNVPAVLMLQQYQTDLFLKDLRQWGFTTIDKSADHYGLTLILGGAEVSLWELAGAYASMGRILSRYQKNRSTYSEKDVHSPRLFPVSPDTSKQYRPSIISAGAIHHTFEALEDAKRPSQEGEWQHFSSRHPIAWKTGTSYGHRDAWAVGVTDKYTVAVWVGNANGEGVADLVGLQKAAPVLFDLFNSLPADRPFQRYTDDLVPASICSLSGHIASPYCDRVDTTLIATSCTESAACPYHLLVHTDEEGQRVDRSCAEGRVHTTSWFVLPAVAEYYYRRLHPTYRELPAYAPECQPDDRESPVAFIYPSRSAEVYVPRDIDGQLEAVVAEAAHKDKDATLYWHLDERYLGETKEMHQMSLIADAGPHLLTIVDQYGNEVRRRFNVVGKQY